MSSADDDADIPVRRSDQDQINEFGRLNNKKHELRDEIQELGKRIDDLSDAEEGVMMVDESVDGSTKLMIGECLVDVDSSEAGDYISRELQNAKDKKESMETKLKQIEVRQAELKKALYARFGRSINLEE